MVYVLAFVVILVIGALLFSRTANNASKSTSDITRLLNRIPQQGVTLGKEDAPITVVEFADLQCPSCRQYALSVLPELLRKYVLKGKVRMELYVVGALGPDSIRAAQVAGAAAVQGRLWQFADYFYHHQEAPNSGYVTLGFLRKAVRQTPELDAKRALRGAFSKRDRLASKYYVQARETAERFNVTKFPTVLIGYSGQKLKPVDIRQLNKETFTKPIDELLKNKHE